MLSQLFFPALATDNCWWIIQWFEKDSDFFWLQHNWTWSKLIMTKAFNFIQRWNYLAVPVWWLSSCPILHLVVGRKWKIKPKDLNTLFLPFSGPVLKIRVWELIGTGRTVSHKTALCRTEKAFKEQHFLHFMLKMQYCADEDRIELK